MKYLNHSGASLIAASVLALAGCGGGSEVAGTAEPASAHMTALGSRLFLQLSGTAATGLAMSDSTVQARCATGGGSTSTDGNGIYTLTIPNATLPCIVRATGELDGSPVILHSLAVPGPINGDGSTAVANITPLTELVIAHTAGITPSALFDAFDARHGQFTQVALHAATTEVLEALRAQTGINFGGMDPFGDQLIAATPSAPHNGNHHDKLLDALMANLEAAALPFVVNQLVAAGVDGQAGALTLADVMKSVGRGNLPGCAAALSGKYRLVTHLGGSTVREFDFKNLELLEPAALTFRITPDPGAPCKFRASNHATENDFVMGPAGVGAWRMHSTGVPSLSSVGYVFPLQPHPVPSLAGDWLYLISGEESSVAHHLPGSLHVSASGAMTSCGYDTTDSTMWSCNKPGPGEGNASGLSAAEPGSFELAGTSLLWRLYAYQAPGGAQILFGASNPDKLLSPSGDLFQMLVATRPSEETMQLPTAGQVTRYWDLELVRTGAETYNTSGPTARETVVSAVDVAGGTFTQTQSWEGRAATFKINSPVAGVRYRAERASSGGDGTGGFDTPVNEAKAGAVTVPAVYQIPLGEIGLFLTINASPADHTYAISVLRR